ncbi:MAG: DUF411 domain-containing protein [Salinarimonadaceae bacterium]|nr:MAG: DUF411 domain-containing protein [Salinarimonadaceae bacterium]
MNRRAFLAASAAMAASPALSPAFGALRPAVVVYRDPNCGCCDYWIEHIREAGFPVEAHDRSDLNRVKARLGVPSALAACHTATVEGYVIEGHVPARAIQRLLAERPRATGLAVPGMPIGSPGMEVPGMAPDVYDVILFAPDLEERFERYRGLDPVVDL